MVRTGEVFYVVIVNSKGQDLSMCKGLQQIDYAPAPVDEAEKACKILKDWAQNFEKEQLQVLSCLLVDEDDVWAAACNSLIGGTHPIRITPLRVYSYDEFLEHENNL